MHMLSRIWMGVWRVEASDTAKPNRPNQRILHIRLNHPPNKTLLPFILMQETGVLLLLVQVSVFVEKKFEIPARKTILENTECGIVFRSIFQRPFFLFRSRMIFSIRSATAC